MAKRSIDSNLFTKDWFLELDPRYQIFYIYMFTHADCAGIFDPNLKTISKMFSFEYTKENISENLGTQIIEINGKWLIKNFFKHQYNNNPSPKMHKPINSALGKIGLNLSDLYPIDRVSIGYRYPNRDRDRDRDKDKDINKGGVGEKEFKPVLIAVPVEETAYTTKSTARASLEEVKKYFTDKTYPETEALEFFAHYNSQGWINGLGNPIINWRSAGDKWHLKSLRNSIQSTGSSYQNKNQTPTTVPIYNKHVQQICENCGAEKTPQGQPLVRMDRWLVCKRECYEKLKKGSEESFGELGALVKQFSVKE